MTVSQATHAVQVVSLVLEGAQSPLVDAERVEVVVLGPDAVELHVGCDLLHERLVVVLELYVLLHVALGAPFGCHLVLHFTLVFNLHGKYLGLQAAELGDDLAVSLVLELPQHPGVLLVVVGVLGVVAAEVEVFAHILGVLEDVLGVDVHDQGVGVGVEQSALPLASP